MTSFYKPVVVHATVLLHEHLPTELVKTMLYEHRGLASLVALLMTREMAKGGNPCLQGIYTAPSIGTMIPDRLQNNRGFAASTSSRAGCQVAALHKRYFLAR